MQLRRTRTNGHKGALVGLQRGPFRRVRQGVEDASAEPEASPGDLATGAAAPVPSGRAAEFAVAAALEAPRERPEAQRNGVTGQLRGPAWAGTGTARASSLSLCQVLRTASVKPAMKRVAKIQARACRTQLATVSASPAGVSVRLHVSAAPVLTRGRPRSRPTPTCCTVEQAGVGVGCPVCVAAAASAGLLTAASPPFAPPS